MSSKAKSADAEKLLRYSKQRHGDAHGMKSVQLKGDEIIGVFGNAIKVSEAILRIERRSAWNGNCADISVSFDAQR